MALTGLHIVAGYAGSYRTDKSQSLLSKISWSEDPASGVTSTNAAPADTDEFGQPVFRLRAAADSWVSIGKTPNASTGTRIFVPANTDYDILVAPGDKLVWIAA